MQIEKKVENSVMSIALEGRLDTMTAPQLEAEVQGKLDGVTELNFDFGKLSYISSAGLRVLLSAQKVMNKQGKMFIRNVCPEIKEIFDVTGFADILTIVQDAVVPSEA
ncbi:MAG: STAS domain-containing protein [Fibrobacter sp.]|nr:STAS domain-containing protein [Fibrobacter sp.]